MANRPLDIVVWGATGFTGSLVAKYLARAYYGEAKAEQIKFAIAGRNQQKLEAVKAQLLQINNKCKDVPVLVGDLADDKSVSEVVKQGRVVISTAGPYALHGEPIVRACARTGTDYVDITGEAIWVKKMMDKYADDIKASGALLISCCGFDSIPSDLGTLFAVNEVKKSLKQPCVKAHGYFALKGGVSGGTIASVFNMLEMPKADLLKARDPYLMNDDDHKPATVASHEKDILLPSYGKDAGAWTGPFVMAAVNSRVVRRSNELLNYGKPFTYNESTMGPFFITFMTWIGLALFGLMSLFGPTRRLLKMILPKPGEGPSEETMQKGWFKALVVAETADGQKVKVELRGGEPGYKCTSEMLSEAALTLALQRNQLPRKSGYLTPAAGLGAAFIERLNRNKVITFNVVQ